MTRFNDKAGGGISRRAKLAGRVAGLTALGLAAVGLAALGAGPSVAQGADDFPSRPITLIVPVAPGGGVDGLARLLAPVMSDVLKQSVVVENVPGAGGTVGLARVAKAAPDGYTIGLGNVGTHAFSQTLYKRPLYDAAADFAPVALLAEQPLALAIRPDLPAENLKEFLAYAKANQSKMQFGSPGLGSGSHIACVMFNAAAGIDVTHVPYKGGGPTMTDLIASRIDYWCPFSATALPLIRSKRIKAVAILATERLSIMPELATAQEQGLAGFEANTWNAMFASKGTPPEAVAILNKAVVEALAHPKVRERMERLGMTQPSADRSSPKYLADFVRAEIKRWAPAVKASGLSIE